MSLLDKLKNKFPQILLVETTRDGMDTIIVDKKALPEVMKFLKENEECPFDQLLDLCGVDYIGQNPRFEVVYHLYSLAKKSRMRVKVKVFENDLKVPTMIPLWEASRWFEREAYDMFGIIFEGHPHLKRLLMWEGFEGHPLRKDYPLNKRQPIPEQLDIV